MIRNVYREGLPFDKAKVQGKNVTVVPILASDFDDGTLLRANTKSKDTARAALLFRIVGVGPQVQSTDIIAGSYCVVSEVALDFADVKGATLVCDEVDIRVVFTEADLAA